MGKLHMSGVKNSQLGLEFQVWVKGEYTHHDPDFMHCVARFYYWQECLDYKEYVLAKGIPCVVRTEQLDGTYRAEWRFPERKSA